MFGKSWTVMRIRGIPIRLHVSLLLFLPYVAFASSMQYSAVARSLGFDPHESALPPIAWGIVLAVALFAAITLHELAHSLVALRNGVGVRSITLMMLGGVSSIEQDVSPPREAWMAFAGPLTSFITAFISYWLYRWVGSRDLRVVFLAFAITNSFIGAFNLLPAFPMDGGRVLRGLLVPRLGLVRATNIATRTGQALAIALAVWGFLNFNVFLMLIAAFIYLGASAERARLNTRDILHGVPVSQLMNDRIGDAWASESAADVARRLFAHNLVGARVTPMQRSPQWSRPPDAHTGIAALGVVTAEDLAPDGRATSPPIGEKVRADLPRVRSDEDASRVLELFLGGQTNTILVVDQAENIVGLLTPAEVERALALANAMGRGHTKG